MVSKVMDRGGIRLLGPGRLELCTDTVSVLRESKSSTDVPGDKVPELRMLTKIRVTMTLRISQFAVVCGLGLLALPGVVQAQAPRYQSPISMPATSDAKVTVSVIPSPAIKRCQLSQITPNLKIWDGAIFSDSFFDWQQLTIAPANVEAADHASG